MFCCPRLQVASSLPWRGNLYSSFNVIDCIEVYCTPSNAQIIMDNLIADIMVGVHQNKGESLTECVAVIKEHPIDRIPEENASVIKPLKRKIKSNNLYLSKADEGNTVVVLDLSDCAQFH